MNEGAVVGALGGFPCVSVTPLCGITNKKRVTQGSPSMILSLEKSVEVLRVPLVGVFRECRLVLYMY